MSEGGALTTARIDFWPCDELGWLERRHWQPQLHPTHTERSSEQVGYAVSNVCWVEINAHGLGGDVHEQLRQISN